MTIPLLIDTILGRLLREHYPAGSQCAAHYKDALRLFLRDKHALTKAIARYGYECARRDWHFDAPKLYLEITTLLDQIRKTGADIKFLPRYLESAVDRSIRLEADRLSADAKRINNVVTKELAKVPRPFTVVVVHQSGAEVLATVYRDLQQRAKERKKTTTRAREAQGKLL